MFTRLDINSADKFVSMGDPSVPDMVFFRLRSRPTPLMKGFKPLASSIYTEMGRRGGGNAGSLRREMTIQKALAGGLSPIRGVKTGGIGHLTINFLCLRISVPMQFVADGLVNVDDQVNVDFPIFEARNEDCWARNALRTDPGYLVAVRLRGTDRNGKTWVRYLKAVGDNNAKKANNIYDWLSDTGISQTDHKIPRRFYKDQDGDGDEVEYT